MKISQDEINDLLLYLADSDFKYTAEKLVQEYKTSNTLALIKVYEKLENQSERMDELMAQMRALTGMMGLLNANVYQRNEQAKIISDRGDNIANN